jgi:hypothetical protein
MFFNVFRVWAEAQTIKTLKAFKTIGPALRVPSLTFKKFEKLKNKLNNCNQKNNSNIKEY